MIEDKWLYVAKVQGQQKFIKKFDSFDAGNVEFTSDLWEAAEFTEEEWTRELGGDLGFVSYHDPPMCFVSFSDEPQNEGNRH